MAAHNATDLERVRNPQALDPEDPGLSEPSGTPTVFDHPNNEFDRAKRRKSNTDPLLAMLNRNYRRRKPPKPSYGIFMDPTGSGWRHEG